MKILNFQCGGDYYQVNEHGHIKRMDIPKDGFFKDWIFLGVSFHHWRNGIDLHLDNIFKDPTKAVGGLVWDRNHGTTRRWGGRYAGRLLRIQSAWITKEN